MSAVPTQLQHLALRIGNATGLTPDAMASNRSGAVAISLHVYGVAADRISSGVNRIYA